MIYKHQYFKLDAESKKVFDENNKELALTGNAYRLLVFLCGKNNATLTDINDHFDPEEPKDYTENHVRQYRYKINSIIGRRVVAYKNNIYSIKGTISKYESNVVWSQLFQKHRHLKKVGSKKKKQTEAQLEHLNKNGKKYPIRKRLLFRP